MNTALSWIKAYVPDLSCTDQEYTDAMTLTGTKVETFERLDKNLEKIYVGQILSIEKHPDADKLIVCQLDMGGAVEGRKLQIVTGAPNVKVGDKVPVVINGGKVAGGHDGGPLPENGIRIKSGKLRGVESFGMMCSIEELGSSRDMYPDAPEEGIYILPESAEVGADAVEVLGLHDTVFEYEITSNRVDCYSVLGIAREAAVTFDKPFHAPEVVVKESEEKASDYISVEVEDSELCPRYCARICTNIKIAPSPEWMQRRLAASGIRPINNLVDITNYVMEEYGQPMHAYDLDTIAGNKIVVKRAKDGDTFLTLDGQERVLDKDMLMINDAEKAIGIAGIMGGENSKITDDVKTVLFEAACFNGANIRKSAKRLGLRTEASGKFEKGLDPKNALDAINRACQLIQELGCGEVAQGVVDVCSGLKPEREIEFRPQRINELLGTDITEDVMLSVFEKLELKYKKDENVIVIPSFRQDLEGIADLAEEVARFYGYDKIPSTLPSGEATTGKLPFKLRIEEKAREIAEFCGFSQAMCYSFESPKVFDKLLLSEDDPARNAIVISNPLGEDFSIMRTVSLNGMLTSLATNYNRRNKDVKLYEFGNIYLAKSLPLTELPDERMQFTLGFYGEGDFFTMKGVVEEFFDVVGMRKKTVYDPNAGKNFLHPGRQANIIYDGVTVGFLGEVHPEVCDNYGIGTKAYVAVLDMPEIVARASFERKYTGVAKFPSVSRDISMVMPKSILVGQIEEIIEQRGGKNLESYSLFDIYEGSQIKEGHKSVAYTVVFRNKERTLEEADINSAMKKILNGLEGLGIELRSLKIRKADMNRSDFYFDLPERLIAQDPLEDRASSRLLVLDKETGKTEHHTFREIVDYLRPGDCLVLNDTKVIPARLLGEKEDTGAAVEILLLKRREKDVWETLVKPGKKCRPGAKISFGGGLLRAEILNVVEEGNRLVKFAYDGIFEEVLDRLGEMPLPPYITHKLTDKNRYQTVYAKHEGSAAAPTAGLHFTHELLERIRAMGVKIVYVTLHVGLGTFRPVKEDDILKHHMHSEYYTVTQEAADTVNAVKKAGGRVICVGTTSCRTVESASDENGLLLAGSGNTEIFIYPGYSFRVLDALVTNFHLPESTLIMLVSALAGRENVLAAYAEAVKEKYRFFSFGDAMFIR